MRSAARDTSRMSIPQTRGRSPLIAMSIHVSVHMSVHMSMCTSMHRAVLVVHTQVGSRSGVSIHMSVHISVQMSMRTSMHTAVLVVDTQVEADRCGVRLW